MNNSTNYRRISLQNQPKLSVYDGRKLLNHRITQTKDEIENLQVRLDKFQAENADTPQKKQYYQERRKFLFQNISLLQKHLGQLIKQQAIIESDDINTNDLESIMKTLEQLSQEGLEIMKSCIQIDNDESLKVEFKKVDEKLKRDYTVAQSEEQLDKQSSELTNYFQQEITKSMKCNELPSYLQFIPRIV